MKTSLLIVLLLISSGVNALSVSEMACGAIVCLAGDGGSACGPYLKKYKSIDGPTSAITKRLRKRFLAKCSKKKAPNMTRYQQDRAIQIENIKREAQ